MRIEVQQYNLPDAELLKETKNDSAVQVFQPLSSCVVLGFGNNAEESVFADRVVRDRIPVYRRPSGGGAVFLSPRMLVISLVSGQKEGSLAVMPVFRRINRRVITALASLGVADLCLRGISDIALGDKKILGSAIYQNREIVFYQAILNVAETVDLLTRYLQHPRREPDYRQQRSHSEFVTSLHESGYTIPITRLADSIREAL